MPAISCEWGRPVLRLLPLVTLLCVVAAGCGGGKEAVAGCGDAGRLSYPAGFPSGLPKPDGYRLTSTHRDGDFTVAVGSATGTLEQVRDFFQSGLPSAGYQLGEGDAEEHEAETEFEGKGSRGKLKIRDFSDCEDRVSLEVAVARD